MAPALRFHLDSLPLCIGIFQRAALFLRGRVAVLVAEPIILTISAERARVVPARLAGGVEEFHVNPFAALAGMNATAERGRATR